MRSDGTPRHTNRIRRLDRRHGNRRMGLTWMDSLVALVDSLGLLCRLIELREQSDLLRTERAVMSAVGRLSDTLREQSGLSLFVEQRKMSLTCSVLTLPAEVASGHCMSQHVVDNSEVGVLLRSPERVLGVGRSEERRVGKE